MHRLLALLAGPAFLRRIARAALISNIGIIITGGAVRLTGSGLGCPTWPRCTADSYVATAAIGVNGAIEFGNRTLTFVLALVAVLGFASAMLQRPRRRRTVRLSVLAGLGIPAQAVVGGVTVLTHLNPWVVGCHFLASIAVIWAAYAFWLAARDGDEIVRSDAPAPVRTLAGLVVAASAAVVVVGTVVTGSGPYAGDAKARRTGLDPGSMSQLHTDLVFLFLGLAIALWFAVRAVEGDNPTPGVRVAWLIGVSAAQSVIGFVQYFTHLPAVIVGTHMAGSAAVWVATLAVWYSVATRTTASDAPKPQAARDSVLAHSTP